MNAVKLTLLAIRSDFPGDVGSRVYTCTHTHTHIRKQYVANAYRRRPSVSPVCLSGAASYVPQYK